MAGRRSKVARDRLTIPEFFDDRSIFITGATGFLGKVLVEKLLRSCPTIRNIYILLREKKGKSIEERLKEMLALPMFIRVKRQDPTLFEKVIPVQGDVTEIGLGLSAADTETLKAEVSIVFHSAASVRFDDKLKYASRINLRGTYETVKLALEMRKLDSFMHVSTSYCVPWRPVIEEEIYPAPDDWRSVLKYVEQTDERTLDVMTPKILGEFPNTYTFTKALAEHVVKDYSDRINSIIFRPSIVISCMKEPLPGWVDNFNGPVGLIIASGKGIVRTIYSDPKSRPDFLPCDLTSKGMIVSTWDRCTSKEQFDGPYVLNAANSDVQSITQADLVTLGHSVSAEVPLNDMLWLPGGNVTKCFANYYLQVLLFHLLPALVIDFILQMYNKKPILQRIQRKIFLANLALAYFVTRQWKFINDRLMALDAAILPPDREEFMYYYQNVDIMEFFRNSAFGGRQYLMKEDVLDLDKAKYHYKRMWWVDRITKVLFLALVGYLLVKFSVIQSFRGLLYGIYLYFYNAILE